MDSKIIRRALLLVTLFVVAMFFIILWANGTFDKKQKTPVVAQTEVEEEVADENGYIYGSDLTAWMNDETFFDARVIGGGKYEVVATEEKEEVVLNVSSVERDLRIKVVNTAGKLVKGSAFSVEVNGQGKFKDADRDGYIYVPDLSPGQYEVSLSDAQGYMAPTAPIKCTVKAKLEYKAIEDISYLIKTEADIDAAKEDTAVTDADSESTGNSAIKTVDNAVFGIDVSKFNGEIDWAQVKDAGVKFAIIRCGYRGSKSGSIVIDPCFEQNIKGATDNGIPVGVYFFTQATSDVEGVEEASAVMSMIKQYKITYPVFIDSESAGGSGRADGLEAGDRTKALEAFCQTIRAGGYKAGVYASKNWLNDRLDITKLSTDNVIWLAEYKDEPTYGGKYQLWQYSSGGSISGIEGRVDMNLSYLDTDR